MFKDKFLIRFYLILIFALVSLYYTGESRTREFKKMGFELCKINGLEMWNKHCPEEKSFFSKIIGDFND